MYTIPFSEESVQAELSGIMAMATIEGNKVTQRQPFGLGGNWQIDSGVLELLDRRGSIQYRIDAVKVASNVCYMSGSSLHRASEDGPVEVVLYEPKPLGDDFHIIISSHVDYVDKTVDRLLRSLHREGINDDRITVAVAGTDNPDDGYVPAPEFDGCAGLAVVADGTVKVNTPYVLLLHDTCEVCHGFAEAASAVDVGFPLGFVGIGGETGSPRELGFWATSLLQLAQCRDFDVPPCQRWSMLLKLQLHGMYTVLGKPVPRREKDVYGLGVQRRVMDLALPVKKFLGTAMTGGRP